MIRFQCECGKKYKAKDSLAGKNSHCKVCGAPIQVPYETEKSECPFCEGEVKLGALKCRHCGERLRKRPKSSKASSPPPAQDSIADFEPSPAPPPPAAQDFIEEPQPSRPPPPPPVQDFVEEPPPYTTPSPPPAQYSLAQPRWHVVLLSVITYGIYQLYWFYRNWKHLKLYRGMKLSPGWRTVGLFVPFLNLYLIYRQFADIKKEADLEDLKFEGSPGWILIIFAVARIWSSKDASNAWNYDGLLVTTVDTLFELWWIVLAAGVLAAVQGSLNRLWEKTQPGLKMRTAFSGGEIACLVFGGLFLLSMISVRIVPQLPSSDMQGMQPEEQFDTHVTDTEKQFETSGSDTEERVDPQVTTYETESEADFTPGDFDELAFSSSADSFIEKCRQAGMEAAAKKLTRDTLPCFQLMPASPDEAKLPNRTQLGGVPDLPDQDLWPKHKGKSLEFIAQVNLSEIPMETSKSKLPGMGMLYFFYDSEQPSGYDPKHKGSWRVVYAEKPPESAEKIVFPDDVHEFGRYPRRCMKAVMGESIPNPLDYIKTSGLPTEKQAALTESYEQYRKGGPPKHQLIGHPIPVQDSDMHLECQLVSNGLYRGDETGYKDPRARELASGARDWRLLMQIDSDESAYMMWGDAGTLYFWIRSEDLRERNFDAVWMIMQCY